MECNPIRLVLACMAGLLPVATAPVDAQPDNLITPETLRYLWDPGDGLGVHGDAPLRFELAHWGIDAKTSKLSEHPMVINGTIWGQRSRIDQTVTATFPPTTRGTGTDRTSETVTFSFTHARTGKAAWKTQRNNLEIDDSGSEIDAAAKAQTEVMLTQLRLLLFQGLAGIDYRGWTLVSQHSASSAEGGAHPPGASTPQDAWVAVWRSPDGQKEHRLIGTGDQQTQYRLLSHASRSDPSEDWTVFRVLDDHTTAPNGTLIAGSTESVQNGETQNRVKLRSLAGLSEQAFSERLAVPDRAESEQRITTIEDRRGFVSTTSTIDEAGQVKTESHGRFGLIFWSIAIVIAALIGLFVVRSRLLGTRS